VCSSDLQKFGDRLPPPFDRSPGALLPSPESLRGKVLLKGGVVSDESNPGEKSIALSRLIHLGTYSLPKEKTGVVEFAQKPAFLMFSASEGKIVQWVDNEDARRKLLLHNKVHLTRSYPKGSRIGSGNYDPTPGWNTGCQVVALNYQTASEPMWLNDAKFRLNGGRGWILKPPYLIDPGLPFPYATTPFVLTVFVDRGGGFPSTSRDIIDPYIEVKLAGWKGTLTSEQRRRRTKTISNNGLDPTWEEEFKLFSNAPELDLLVIYLWDAGATDDILGHFVVPLVAVREGVHSVAFIDGSRERKPIPGAYLLCKFTKGQA
jgi:hypothetical protein